MSKKKRKRSRKYPYQKPAGSFEHRLSMARDFSKMIDMGAESEERSLVRCVLANLQTTSGWAEYTDAEKRLVILDLTAAARMAIIHHSLH